MVNAPRYNLERRPAVTRSSSRASGFTFRPRELADGPGVGCGPKLESRDCRAAEGGARSQLGLAASLDQRLQSTPTIPVVGSTSQGPYGRAGWNIGTGV